MENEVNSTEKLVNIGDRQIDKEIAKYCLEKADVIEAAKTTAEVIVEGMISIFRR